jgi:hypothetical protein
VIDPVGREHLRGLQRREARAHIVLVYGHKRHGRAMRLAPYWTRCVRQGDIDELVVTVRGAQSGDQSLVDDVAYIGFVEFEHGSVVVVGDRVLVGDRPLGTLLGFDETHAPNHVNLVVEARELLSGAERRVGVEDTVRFLPCPAAG